MATFPFPGSSGSWDARSGSGNPSGGCEVCFRVVAYGFFLPMTDSHGMGFFADSPPMNGWFFNGKLVGKDTSLFYGNPIMAYFLLQ